MQKLSFNRLSAVALLCSVISGGAWAHANDAFDGREKLRSVNKEFEKRIVTVADGIYAAVGYSASNVTLIQSRSGSIIIDTAANPVDAQAIMQAFGHHLQQPVKAIIYTHNHPDHTGGTTVFAGRNKPQIYSHQLLLTSKPDIGRGRRDGGDAFGTQLPPEDFINAGTQLEYGRVTAHTRAGYIAPTVTVDGVQQELTIDGIELRLIHTPGEADENISVWLPAHQVLIAGDIFLKTFPNIAPLRGLPTRPVDKWISSLDRLIALKPQRIVPGHMGIITNTDEAQSALAAYRDGLQFIYTKTKEGMAAGLTVEELLEQVRLPERLARHLYLQEFYGTVAWAVRGIYAQNVGWFDGNPTNIYPLSTKERAEKLVVMAGGPAKMLASAEAALEQKQFQWAAEQADYLLALDPGSMPALGIKARALRELGERQMNATARNYYLTVANSLSKRLHPATK